MKKQAFKAHRALVREQLKMVRVDWTMVVSETWMGRAPEAHQYGVFLGERLIAASIVYGDGASLFGRTPLSDVAFGRSIWGAVSSTPVDAPEGYTPAILDGHPRFVRQIPGSNVTLARWGCTACRAYVNDRLAVSNVGSTYIVPAWGCRIADVLAVSRATKMPVSPAYLPLREGR